MFPLDTRILIVDDMKFMRKTVRHYLDQMGYKNVTDADDGDTAWGLIESKAGGDDCFQLVICDWNMPRLKGIQVLEKVRKHAKSEIASLPFIMLTAETEVEQVKEAIGLKVSGYIAKPFKAETLQEKLGITYKALHTKKAA